MEKETVAILIPAFNESRRIQDTVKAIMNSNKVDQVIVINDCSTDATGELAHQAGARVLNLQQNLGKGGALNFGLQHIESSIIGILDGDLGKSALEIERLLEPVLSNKVDMTIGRFPPAKRKGGFGLVTALARKGIRMFTGLEVASPLSGQRVLRRGIIEKIGTFESGFGVEVGLTIDVFRHGFRVKEIPVQMSHSETGRNLAGFLHRGRQFLDVLRVLTKRLFHKR